MSSGKLNLVLYVLPPGPTAATISEHAFSLAEFSQFRFVYVNAWYGFPAFLKKYDFQLIVIHYSFGQYMLPEWKENHFRQMLAESDAYKAAFFQDEHHNCVARFKFINECKIDCIYSLLDPPYARKVYGEHTKASAIHFTLTGYVPKTLSKLGATYGKPFDARTIDVGYRGRAMAYRYGIGGQEKADIALGFLKHGAAHGLVMDISTAEDARIYGDDWYRFLGNCKATLAAESGVSIFDLDGSIAQRCEEYLRLNVNASFDAVQRDVLAPFEEQIPYRTSSPRLFEAAALRTCQMCYEGRYSGVIEPMKHYIPIKKDFSNFAEAAHLLKDRGFVLKMLDKAFEDLIASGDYSYERFVAGVDKDLKGVGLALDVDETTHLAAVSDADRALRRAKNFHSFRTMFSFQFPGRKLVVKPAKQLIRRLGVDI